MAHTELCAQLKPLFGPCCGEPDHLPVAKVTPDLTALLDDLIEYVWATKGAGKAFDIRMIRYFAELYWQGVKEGYGKDLNKLADHSTDARMVESIRSNVWQFSAAKNYSQLRALGNALIGEDGKILSETAFKKAAFEINSQHVGPWLTAEYDLAFSGSQMASKWTDAKENNVPLLEFDAVMDNHTTRICASLNGVVKPINDPFWNIYYPPNHFLCRSTARDRYNGAITSDHNITFPDIPPMFQTNLAKDGLVFPKGHPYFKDVPDQVLQTAEHLKNKQHGGK